MVLSSLFLGRLHPSITHRKIESYKKGLPEWLSKLVPAKAGNAFLTGDATEKRDDFSKNTLAIHSSPDDRQVSQYFAAKIGLTHKILPHMLPPRKRKFNPPTKFI
jgi:hypothetical protein